MFGLNPMELLIVGVVVCPVFLAFVGLSVFMLVKLSRGRGTNPNLVSCPDCGRQISRMAQSCPGCGKPAV